MSNKSESDFYKILYFKCWTCEFCNGDNIMDVEDDEKPKTEDVTFMLKPALTTLASGLSGVDRMMMVVFCIDVSGSMCVTTEVRH